MNHWQEFAKVRYSSFRRPSVIPAPLPVPLPFDSRAYEAESHCSNVILDPPSAPSSNVIPLDSLAYDEAE